MLDFLLDVLMAVLGPGRSRAAQERSSTRKFLKARQLMFPVFMGSGSGRSLGGFLRIDDSSLRFSLDSDGRLCPVNMSFDQFKTYSTAENAPTRKSMPLLVGADRWHTVVHLLGPTRDVTVAYDPRYNAVVTSVLDAAGVRRDAPE